MHIAFKTILLLTLVPISSLTYAQNNNPTVKVPKCLLYPDSNTYVPCTGVVPVDNITGNAISWSSIFNSNGSSTSDATALNQNSQIAAEQAIRDRIGDITSPATGTVNARLNQLNVALNGTLTVGTHAVTQSGAFNVGVTGSLPAGTNALGSVSVSNLPASQVVTSTQLPTSLGQQSQANSLPVALASDGPVGQRTDAAATTTDITSTSLISQVKQTNVKLANLATSANQPAVATSGSVAPTTGTMLIGRDVSGNAQPAKIDTLGNLQVLANPPSQSQDKTTRVSTIGSSATYNVSVTNLVPAANPTDVAVVSLQNEFARTVLVKRISIRAVGDSAGLVDTYINFRGSTSPNTVVQASSSDYGTYSSVGYLGTFSSNPSNTTTSKIIQGKLQIGTVASPAPELVFEWNANERPPSLKGITGAYNNQISVNFGGAALPTNTKVDINVRWVEEPVRVVVLAGDSLFAGTTNLVPSLLRNPGALGFLDIRNYGNNGKRLIDLLPTASQNTGGLNYTFANIISTIPAYGYNQIPSDVVEGYLTNDIRDGSTTLPQAISLLDAFLYIMKNGCVSGQSWTSTKSGGAGTTFTWNATISARPYTRVWLLGPNSYLADDPSSSGAIPSSGIFAGMTQAQASQAATDIVYNAYQAFVGDSRVAGVGQRQTYVSPTMGFSFGRTVRNGANNPLMANLLHPNNTFGEPLVAEQITDLLSLKQVNF